MSKRVICKSGISGWQCKLQKNYANFEEFENFCEIYGLLPRLGFDSAKKAWDENPTIQGSVNPRDFRKI